MSTDEKLEWLLSRIEITDVDLWENDGLLRMKPIYFQFNRDEVGTVEEILNRLLKEEKQ